MMLLNFTIDIEPSVVQDKNKKYERLIIEIGKGSTPALEQLYICSKSEVYGYALSILKNAQNAEDVMQDTYVKIFHAAKGYQPQGKPLAWILTIVRNLALSRFRLSDNRNLPLNDDFLRPLDNDFTETSAEQMVLRKAFEGLGSDELQIVILHGVAGLKHREIAEVTQIPLSTVLSKYRRALAKLQKLIKEDA